MPSPALSGTGSASGRGGSFAVVRAGPDILEEEPPRPREGWAHLRTVTSGTVDTGRRTTLGQPILIDLNDDDLDLRHRFEQGYPSARRSTRSAKCMRSSVRKISPSP